ncbi:MAG TPA: hypothetical protein PK364_08535 [Synergistaceae bacterium]|nr:hypothetical protein [Synergistaceae bacterium]HPJ25764.1 hypothetical protein [Synergistaceae bacterium]HPQ37471.1 hypothetical protein [Synergistaceae bacterium]
MWEHFFESIMLLCFGAAWPGSIYKSWKSRSNKGKSLIFLVIIFLGYIAGILKNLMAQEGLTGIIFLYCANGIMVGIDMGLYYRNHFFDRARTECSMDMGMAYTFGVEIQKDPVKGYLYFEQAAKDSSGEMRKMAKNALENLTETMSPEQLKKAREISGAS